MSIVRQQITNSTKILQNDFLNLIGTNNTGLYEITDSDFSVDGGNVFIELYRGMPGDAKRTHFVQSVGSIQISEIIGASPSMAGTLHIEINSFVVSTSISYNSDIDSASVLARRIFDNSYYISSYNWAIDGTNLYVKSPAYANSFDFNGATVSVVFESESDVLPITTNNMDGGKAYLQPMIYDLKYGDVLSASDARNNVSSFYGELFPFYLNTDQVYDNNFQLDGGSALQHWYGYMYGCCSFGYASINAFGSNANFNQLIVDNSIYVDVTGLTSNQNVSGKIIGNNDFDTTVYLTESFNGEINFLTGISTLQKTFTVYSAEQPTSSFVATGDGNTATYTPTVSASNQDYLKPTTIQVTAIVNGSLDTLTDDGNGNLSSTNGSTGTVNYYTGEFNFTFYANVDNGQNVNLGYVIVFLDNSNINFNESQDRHWTGVVFLDNYNPLSIIWSIDGIVYAPEYFKIVVPSGQAQGFGPGTWAIEYFGGPPGPFLIGGAGNGGEISFRREKNENGSFTGNLLAYDIVYDYAYD